MFWCAVTLLSCVFLLFSPVSAGEMCTPVTMDGVTSNCCLTSVGTTACSGIVTMAGPSSAALSFRVGLGSPMAPPVVNFTLSSPGLTSVPRTSVSPTVDVVGTLSREDTPMQAGGVFTMVRFTGNITTTSRPHGARGRLEGRSLTVESVDTMVMAHPFGLLKFTYDQCVQPGLEAHFDYPAPFLVCAKAGSTDFEVVMGIVALSRESVILVQTLVFNAEMKSKFQGGFIDNSRTKLGAISFHGDWEIFISPQTNKLTAACGNVYYKRADGIGTWIADTVIGEIQ